MSIEKEFSKHAKEYDNYNIIQQQVIKDLLLLVKDKPKKIVDIGCGRGGVCSAISWEYSSFFGLDFSKEMLELHPASSAIKTIQANFNDVDFFKKLSSLEFDFIFSASALQWVDDLEMTFKNLSELSKPLALAIFTSKTFSTLHKTASIKPILRSAKTICDLAKKYFGVDGIAKEYVLGFDSTLDAIKYIKKSGVSGNDVLLSYKNMKKLLRDYPLDYLEFEVVFIVKN